MRQLRLPIAAILALVLAESASAQTNNFSTALTGVKASDIQFKPIDTSSALQGSGGVLAGGTSNNRFSLTGFFRRLTGPSPAPIMGMSNIPAAQYAPAVSPRPPILSTVPTSR